MRFIRFLGSGCLCGLILLLCLPSHAAALWTGRPVRAVSSFTQAVPPATDQDQAPVVASDNGTCTAGDQTSGPYDNSVPPKIPDLRSRVTDLTGHLSADCIASISDRIRSLEDQKGAQVRVLLVGSTGGEPIEQYAGRVFHAWKLGRKGVDDGVLLVTALHDHHDRIQVGYGLEGAIPDAVAGNILRTDLHPQFIAGDYGAGVSAAVDDLAHLIRGEALPRPAPRGGWMRWHFMVVALLLVCLAGAVGSLAQWRWYWRLTLPFFTLALVDASGLVWHQLSSWTAMLAVIPFALVAYLAGIFFANYPKSGLLWLACTTGTFAAAVAVKHAFTHPVLFGQTPFWNLEAGMASLVIGSIVFIMTTRNPMVGRHSFSSGSSSGTGNESSSSSSDSSSGGGGDSGGGDSGGGGASGSW